MLDSEVNLNTLELLITYKQVFIIVFKFKTNNKSNKTFTPCLNYNILFLQLFLLKHVYICFKV